MPGVIVHPFGSERQDGLQLGHFRQTGPINESNNDACVDFTDNIQEQCDKLPIRHIGKEIDIEENGNNVQSRALFQSRPIKRTDVTDEHKEINSTEENMQNTEEYNGSEIMPTIPSGNDTNEQNGDLYTGIANGNDINDMNNLKDGGTISMTQEGKMVSQKNREIFAMCDDDSEEIDKEMDNKHSRDIQSQLVTSNTALSESDVKNEAVVETVNKTQTLRLRREKSNQTSDDLENATTLRNELDTKHKTDDGTSFINNIHDVSDIEGEKGVCIKENTTESDTTNHIHISDQTAENILVNESPERDDDTELGNDYNKVSTVETENRIESYINSNEGPVLGEISENKSVHNAVRDREKTGCSDTALSDYSSCTQIISRKIRGRRKTNEKPTKPKPTSIEAMVQYFKVSTNFVSRTLAQGIIAYAEETQDDTFPWRSRNLDRKIKRAKRKVDFFKSIQWVNLYECSNAVLEIFNEPVANPEEKIVNTETSKSSFCAII